MGDTEAEYWQANLYTSSIFFKAKNDAVFEELLHFYKTIGFIFHWLSQHNRRWCICGPDCQLHPFGFSLSFSNLACVEILAVFGVSSLGLLDMTPWPHVDRVRGQNIKNGYSHHLCEIFSPWWLSMRSFIILTGDRVLPGREKPWYRNRLCLSSLSNSWIGSVLCVLLSCWTTGGFSDPYWILKPWPEASPRGRGHTMLAAHFHQFKGIPQPPRRVFFLN